MWQSLGTVNITNRKTKLTLKDLTGFEGRCDALYFTTDNTIPPEEMGQLDKFRRANEVIGHIEKKYDLVVCGGGIAGICTAISAARNGLKVVLINDRPVLGGNNSSEVNVNTGGRIELKPYSNLGNLIKEFGNTKGMTMKEGDLQKIAFVRNEPNVDLYLNNRVFEVTMNRDEIASVTSKNINTNDEILFKAPLFVDCTGDGCVGALAGADFMMGREAQSEYNESRAPKVADKMTMGTSIRWYSKEMKGESKFPLFEYGISFSEQSAEQTKHGNWRWETGMSHNTVTDTEYIRDYGLITVYSNWSFLKNKSIHKENYKHSQFSWISYVNGKRESRRLTGDLVLSQNDILDYIEYPDGTACASWTLDVHHPDPENTKYFPGEEFKAGSAVTRLYPYPIPYRCLYSRNVNNLFMAGRDISVTHVALGTTRLMRTCGMLGEVVGMAASICRTHDVSPRRVYQVHFPELIEKMKEGAGKQGLENNQDYTLGSRLFKKPVTSRPPYGLLKKVEEVELGR